MTFIKETANSVNSLAQWHHPWASEYTPTLLPPTVNLFFLRCLSVCLSAGVPAPEDRKQMAGLKVPLTHLQGRKGPWSLWLLISISKIQHTRSPVLTCPLPLPHLILKGTLVDRGRGGTVSAAAPQLPLCQLGSHQEKANTHPSFNPRVLPRKGSYCIRREPAQLGSLLS